MKKHLFMVAAVVLMAMISCNKEEMNNVGEPQEPQTPEVVEPSYYVEFTADLGAEETVTPTVQQSATRTTIDVVNKKTLWVDSDAISVNGKKFVVKELIDGGLSARFVNEGELGTDFKAPYTAKYPYKANGTIEIPASQTAVQGGIDPAYVPAVAYSDDNSLKFKHAASLLKFQVPAACKEVKLSSDDALAGTLTVTMPNTYDGTPTVSASGKEVTISGDFKTGKDYYIAVLPGKKNNFVVRIDGYLSKNAASVTVNRSTIADMKALPAAEDANWRLKGTFDWSNGKVFYKDLNNYIVVKNVTFDSTTEFKAHNLDGKDEWCRAAANVVLGNQWYKIGQYDGANSRIIKGTYDVYVDPKGYNIYFITAGEKLTAAIPTSPEVTVYLNVTTYTHLWCWNKDKTSENFTGGSWPGQNSTTNVTINGKTYRKWVLKSCNIGVYTNMIFSKNGGSQTGEDGNTGLLMGETMFVQLVSGKTRFYNDI